MTHFSNSAGLKLKQNSSVVSYATKGQEAWPNVQRNYTRDVPEESGNTEQMPTVFMTQLP